MSDWSAVYLREVVGSPEAVAGWGFSAYAFFMASGRFLGDALIGRFGSKPLLRMGGLVAAAGLLLAFFFQMIRPSRILEIGTFTGYSCICLAEGLVENG